MQRRWRCASANAGILSAPKEARRQCNTTLSWFSLKRTFSVQSFRNCLSNVPMQLNVGCIPVTFLNMKNIYSELFFELDIFSRPKGISQHRDTYSDSKRRKTHFKCKVKKKGLHVSRVTNVRRIDAQSQDMHLPSSFRAVFHELKALIERSYKLWDPSDNSPFPFPSC